MPHAKWIIVSFLLFAVLAHCQDCLADIYQHVDEDGVTWFTDNPKDERFRMVMRDQKRQAKTGRRPATGHFTGEYSAPRANGLSSGSASTSNGPLTLPVQGKITSLSGLRHDPIDGKLRHHKGVDIAAPTGTPVKPVAPGVVAFSGFKPGYGNMVIIDHQTGTLTVYAHHSTNLVQAGDQVTGSTVIALSGSTGRSTGPHLHFEAWQDGENVTNSYLPGNTAGQPLTVAARLDTPIRRMLQDDGTLLFTNLR